MQLLHLADGMVHRPCPRCHLEFKFIANEPGDLDLHLASQLGEFGQPQVRPLKRDVDPRATIICNEFVKLRIRPRMSDELVMAFSD